MNTLVKKLSNEAILLVTYSDDLSASACKDVFRQSHDLTLDYAQVYRIHDIRKLGIPFCELIDLMRSADNGLCGGASDPRFYSVFVATNKLMKQAEAMMQTQGFSVPIFNDLEEAILFCRENLHLSVSV